MQHAQRLPSPLRRHRRIVRPTRPIHRGRQCRPLKLSVRKDSCTRIDVTLGSSSNSTLETQSQNFVDFTIDPWFIPWEQECDDKLLRESEKAAESHKFEFDRNDLIRVDSDKLASNNRTALGGHPYKKVPEVCEEEGLDHEPHTDFIPNALNMGGAAGAASDAGTGDTAGDTASEISNFK